MQLHELKSPFPRKRSKPRVGRGGKRGTTAGHGTKGQKSRAGHRIRPAMRDLIQRIPKRRGVKNFPTSDQPAVVNVGSLDRFQAGTIITRELLLKAGLVRPRSTAVKVLGDGKLEKSLIFEGMLVSKSAKSKIEAAGGTVRTGSKRV